MRGRSIECAHFLRSLKYGNLRALHLMIKAPVIGVSIAVSVVYARSIFYGFEGTY